MSIYRNENISKIAKLSPHKFLHLVQNHENICTRKWWRIQYIHIPHSCENLLTWLLQVGFTCRCDQSTANILSCRGLNSTCTITEGGWNLHHQTLPSARPGCTRQGWCSSAQWRASSVRCSGTRRRSQGRGHRSSRLRRRQSWSGSHHSYSQRKLTSGSCIWSEGIKRKS